MMKTMATAVVMAFIVVTGTEVQASPELSKAKNCQACHAAASRLVGPSFKDIAAKYAGDGAAAARLEQKIRKGSTGVWGPIPMPANPQVSEAEARSLTQWILSQK